MRADGELPDDKLLHVCLLTYASDLTLLNSVLARHRLDVPEQHIQRASLDHAMWFHRPFRADEWLLYECYSPTASGSRGLATGPVLHAATAATSQPLCRKGWSGLVGDSGYRAGSVSGGPDQAPADRAPVDRAQVDTTQVDRGPVDRAQVDRARYDAATAAHDPPFAIIDTAAFAANAADIAILAGETPVRVASKSVRCRGLLADVLTRPGFAGIMAYSLAEAVWLARSGLSRDILVGYPTTDRSAIDSLIADPGLRASITLMVDDVEQLNVIDSIVPPRHRGPIRVCLDLDASWRPLGGLAHVGVRRSPLHDPAPLTELASLCWIGRGSSWSG